MWTLAEKEGLKFEPTVGELFDKINLGYYDPPVIENFTNPPVL